MDRSTFFGECRQFFGYDLMRVDPEDPERDNVSRLEVARDDFVDPERDDISRLEGMRNDFVDPERDDISRLEGMKSRKSILIIA